MREGDWPENSGKLPITPIKNRRYAHDVAEIRGASTDDLKT